MLNKIYYHDLKNTDTVELGHCKSKTELTMYHDGGVSKILLNSNTYTIFGNNLPNVIKIYYDETNDLYYIVKNSSTNTNRYLSIESITSHALGSGIISGKAKTIDVSNFILCTQSNVEKKEPINIVEYSVEANETMEYTSINKSASRYQVLSSLIIINARNSQGTYIANVYHMYKRNDANSNVYTMDKISGTGTESNFNVTPTNNGFTCTNANITRYKITEITTSIQ